MKANGLMTWQTVRDSSGFQMETHMREIGRMTRQMGLGLTLTPMERGDMWGIGRMMSMRGMELRCGLMALSTRASSRVV